MKCPHRFLKLPLPPPVVSSNENNEKFNPLTARRSEFVSKITSYDRNKSLRILSCLQSFLFETSTVKIAKVTSGHCQTILALIGDLLEKCFPAKFHSKNSPEYPEATDMH